MWFYILHMGVVVPVVCEYCGLSHYFSCGVVHHIHVHVLLICKISCPRIITQGQYFNVRIQISRKMNIYFLTIEVS